MAAKSRRRRDRLSPDDILFTQDSISSTFHDGTLLTDTFQDLLYRRLTVDDISAIEVVQDCDDQLWWVVGGNRRLYLYKRMQELGVVTTVPGVMRSGSDNAVQRLFDKRFTTKNYGRSVRILDSQGRCTLDNIEEEWKQQQELYQQKALHDMALHEVCTKCDTDAYRDEPKAYTKCSTMLKWLAGATAVIVVTYILMRKKPALDLEYSDFPKLPPYFMCFV